MALSAKLELRQGQQLVMTPQLQQAIRLLQFSNLELAEFVDSELERNPLLEREEPAQTKSAEEIAIDATASWAPTGAGRRRIWQRRRLARSSRPGAGSRRRIRRRFR